MGDERLTAGLDPAEHEVSIRIQIRSIDASFPRVLDDRLSWKQFDVEAVGSLRHFDGEAAIRSSGGFELRSGLDVDGRDFPVRDWHFVFCRNNTCYRAAHAGLIRTGAHDGPGVARNDDEGRQRQQKTRRASNGFHDARSLALGRFTGDQEIRKVLTS